MSIGVAGALELEIIPGAVSSEDDDATGVEVEADVGAGVGAEESFTSSGKFVLHILFWTILNFCFWEEW